MPGTDITPGRSTLLELDGAFTGGNRAPWAPYKSAAEIASAPQTDTGNFVLFGGASVQTGAVSNCERVPGGPWILSPWGWSTWSAMTQQNFAAAHIQPHEVIRPR